MRQPFALVSLSLVLIFGVACAPPKNSGLSGSDAAFFADTAEYFGRLEKLGFAGGLVVMRGNQTLLHAGYGMADREADRLWSVDTISTVGSITKQFTGAAILLLQDDGLLSVDDPITEYFPDVPADKRSITLHQLLTHSSGIVDLAGLDDWDPIDRETFVRRALEQPLEFDPGSSYTYSNAGYSLLAAIIILAIMILPTIALTSDAALRSVPDSYYHAAASLGCSRWGTIRGVAMPAAKTGIMTGIILGAGRAIGETMAVLMVCGNVVQSPDSLFAPIRTLTANIALEMAYAMDIHRSALFTTGLILMILVAALILTSNYMELKKYYAGIR